MTTINNVHLDSLVQAIKAAEADPTKAWRPQRVEGEWVFEEGGAQFRAEIPFEGGKVTFETDQPTTLGGGGTRPGPMHYCFFGLAACYTSTFATIASQMGIRLQRLGVKLEAKQNFSRVFGLSQAPVLDEVQISLSVRSDAPREKLMEAERLAQERCPAVYTLTNPVRLAATLEVEG